jgi:SAM-dependent methyltransferase
MFDFVRKKDIWDACDKGYLEELKSKNISYQLKSAQDLSIYRLIRELRDLELAEIGGGNSRILECLAINNRCSNIEKFEGKALGPAGEIKLNSVRNINCYVGDFDPLILDSQFDLIFSISVVEHVETDRLEAFFNDSLRILRPGGKFYHAIDMYLQDLPTNYNLERFEIYKRWVVDNNLVVPIGNVFSGGLEFSTDMISNPDNILYGWNKLAPSLSQLRAGAQSVSLLIGAIKK